MLRTSRLSFKIAYYCSSLLPVYTFLVVFMVILKLETHTTKALISRLFTPLTGYKCVFWLFVVLTILSVFLLFKVKAILEDTLKHSNSLGKNKVSILGTYNSGYREFILSFVLPLISTFSVDDYPWATFIMVILFEIIMYIFFINSSDFFPNIALIVLGYSIFNVKSVDNVNIRYAFGKTKDIDSLIKTKSNIEVVTLGENNFPSNVGVIKTKE